MNPTANVETITPIMAKKLLDKNTKNRSVNDEHVLTLSSAMSKNTFELTGESIKIAEDGSLLDGQHRLLAIIKSGKSIKMLVTRGLSNDAFKYIDTGRNRKASDVLSIEGYTNPAKLASMIKFVINFTRGQFWAAAKNDSSKRKYRVTNADVSDFMGKNKDSVLESYPYGFNKFNKLIKGHILSSFHYIIKKSNEAQADDFCHKVAYGQDLSKDSPIFLLRQRLLTDIRSSKKMSSLEKVALLCKAWNFYKSNKTVSVLKWDAVKEPFPKPI